MHKCKLKYNLNSNNVVNSIKWENLLRVRYILPERKSLKLTKNQSCKNLLLLVLLFNSNLTTHCDNHNNKV